MYVCLYISKRNSNSKRHTLPSVPSGTIYSEQDMEATSCPYTDDWFKKLWCIYTVEHCSAIEGSCHLQQQHGGT